MGKSLTLAGVSLLLLAATEMVWLPLEIIDQLHTVVLKLAFLCHGKIASQHKIAPSTNYTCRY